MVVMFTILLSVVTVGIFWLSLSHRDLLISVCRWC